LALNLLNTSETCRSCVKNYTCKHKLKKGSTFQIQCGGIPESYVGDETASLIPAHDNIALLLDPVTWAAEVLDWHCLDPDHSVWIRKNAEERDRLVERFPGRASNYHRPYQAEMLRCLQGDSKIFLADGTVRNIKDVKVGDKVVTYNENRKQTQNSYKVLNTWDNGLKNIYKIELTNGDILKVTDNHPILSWVKAGATNQLFGHKSFKRVYSSIEKGLSVGDRVYTLNSFGIFGNENSINLAKLLGYIVTDGYVSNTSVVGQKHVVQFSNTRREYVEEFADLVQKHFKTNRPLVSYRPAQISKDGVSHKEFWTISISGKSHPLLVFLRDIGCRDKYTRELSITNFAFKFSKEALSYFINRSWSGDGCVYLKKENHLSHLRVVLSLSSGSDDFLRLYRLLLKKIGIATSKVYVDMKKNGDVSRSLVINRISDIETFLNFSGPIYGKEQKSLLALSETKKRNHNKKRGKLKTTTRTKIKSIELIGQEPVYDIEVDTRHNFVSDGVIVHNCTAERKIFRIGRRAGKTESLVISILFHMFTNNNFKVVLITPFQSQIDLIFARLQELLQSKPALSNSIRRNVKAPQYSMELHNGSYIKGFTAGTKSGSGAASARGQDANMLVFDEADYLSKADVEAAMAITIDHPDALVWMSSTPSGKREKFYDNCRSDKWREFHYSSAVNPNWDPEMEQYFRDEYTDIGYKHEVLADFGEQEEGVFQVQYVEAAQVDYEYEDMSPQPSWLYSIGVDWNSPAIGTTIRVIGFNPATSKFYIVDQDIVQRAGWTQLAACDRIAEFNRKWRPFAIYVDRGYGAMQVEVLHKFGYDSMSNPEKGPKHIDSRLPFIVKAYDFGSKVETHDPFTKEKVNKPAKGFLVENSVRRFEAGDILFPESDIQMAAELMGYIVKNVSPTGQFVYATNSEGLGDHNLDALMLALVAFTLEKTSFGKPGSDHRILFSPIRHNNFDPNMGSGAPTQLQQAQAAKPDNDRSAFENPNKTQFGYRARESLPLWTEPVEKQRKESYIPGRSNVSPGRGSDFRKGARGGPPKRKNI